MARDAKEATKEAIDACVVNPGTHYFNVQSTDLARVRASIYDAASRTGRFIAHTSYNNKHRKLRVIIEG